MTSKLNHIRNLVNSLTVSDMVDPRTKKQVPYHDIVVRLNSLGTDYFRSAEFQERVRLARIKSESATEARKQRETRRGTWARNYLKVGDIVQVTGSKAQTTVRKVIAIRSTGFDNLQYDVHREKTLPQGAETSYGKIVQLYNPMNRRWDSIDDLINGTTPPAPTAAATKRGRAVANAVLQPVPGQRTSDGGWPYPG